MRLRRSCLAVPGSSPKMLEKARSLPADQVFLDLEDAVAPSEKTDATRQNIVDALQQELDGEDEGGAHQRRRDAVVLAGRRRTSSRVPARTSTAS